MNDILGLILFPTLVVLTLGITGLHVWWAIQDRRQERKRK